MKSWKKPTPEEVDRAIALLAHIEHRRYFFDKLQNPEWLEPLWNKGFFKNPPPPVQEENGIRYPIWPESKYLARMAALKPDLVLDIIINAPHTENALVHQDFIDAALQMPPKLSVKLVKKIYEWVKDSFLPFYSDRLGQLMIHLLNGQYINESFKIANFLLEILPDPKIKLKEQLKGPFNLPPEPTTKLELWNYQNILNEYVSKLVDAEGLKAMQLLFNCLCKAIEYSKTQKESESQKSVDYSHIWYPKINEPGRYSGLSIKKLLVKTICEFGDRLIIGQKISLAELIKAIERYPYKVFKRIALYFIEKYGEQNVDLITGYLTNQELFNDSSVRHEYHKLLSRYFNILNDNDQLTILNWIEMGPDLQKYKETIQQWKGKEATQEELEIYRKKWQRDHLHIINHFLENEWKAKYESLISELGPPKEEEIVAERAVWIDQKSPKSYEELKNMSINDLINFLKQWQPAKSQFAPSPEGLGRILTSIVAKEPDKFAKNALKFKEMEKTYIRAIISGFSEALKGSNTFPWPPILELCVWIVNQVDSASESINEEENEGRDPNWNLTLKEVARLIENGLSSTSNQIPISKRKVVWEIIEPLTKDSDPTPEYEEQYGGDNLDPFTMSINTTRGEAMHALMQYALWIRRYFEQQDDKDELIKRGFDEMPEVQTILEKHLDISYDPSLTIRSVYGRWLPWLVLLDSEWTSKYISQIFPQKETDLIYRKTAWTSYIVFNKVYDNVFNILYSEYEAAIDRLPSNEKSPLRNTDEKLAEHLMVSFWRNKIDIDSPLLLKFWNKAPDMLRAYAISFIGQSLKDTLAPIPDNILQRLKSLWEYRFKSAKQSKELGIDKKEISEFGWWAISEKFDEQWVGEQLILVLELCHEIKPEESVVEFLSKISMDFPLISTKCLGLIVKYNQNSMNIYLWKEHARSILSNALHSNNENAIELAKQVIDNLGRKGFIDFRELLD